MVFSSAIFLFAFLPAVVLLHAVLPGTRIKNALLILASLLFYSWGEPVYVLLLLLSVGMNYFFGRLAANASKPALISAVVVNLMFLVVFKYAELLVETVNLMPFVNLPVPELTMPIGISFYTFQALSYVIDTYRTGKDAAGLPDASDAAPRYGSFFDVLMYICLFPQLVAGPIVKYNSVKERLHYRKVTPEGMFLGVRRFIVGLAKKMLIANVMAVAADKMFGLPHEALDGASAWVGAVSYLFQIYFDFSGYSDMAVGMGWMFGFDFPENFDYPYTACSVREFWKKWHISLTSWFREYLYFPLGGNRKGHARTMWNRFFVFVCTGIWHGANWTFLVWGIYHGALTMAETAIGGISRNKAKTPEKPSVYGRLLPALLGHIYTLLAVTIGFVIFRADNIMHSLRFLGAMFTFGSTPAGTSAALSVMSPLFVITAIIAAFACMPLTGRIRENAFVRSISMAGTLIMYILCIMEIAAGSYNPFIYFRF